MKLTDVLPDYALADLYEETGDPRAWSKRWGMDLAEIPERDYFVGVYTVTQSQYERVMGENPSFFKVVDGENTRLLPVESVSWEEAKEFCKRLSKMDDSLTYRLPTEEEWEDACRAGTTTEFNFGDSISSTQANFNGNYPYGGAKKGPYLKRPCQVGFYEPNAWGLYDMHGNVWEWTSSRNGSNRVIRGGSWCKYGQHCRSAKRCYYGPAYRLNGLGFRVVAYVKTN